MDLHTNPADKSSAALSHVPPQQAAADNRLYVEKEEDTRNPMVSPVFATPEQILSGWRFKVLYIIKGEPEADNIKFLFLFVDTFRISMITV